MQQNEADEREYEKDLTQTYGEIPYTHRNSKQQRDNTTTSTSTSKTSITQRLLTDLRRSVAVTTATSTGVVKPAYKIYLQQKC